MTEDEKIGEYTKRAATIVGAAALWPSLFNQLLYPVTFTFFTTQDNTSYAFNFIYTALATITAIVLAFAQNKGDSLLLNNGKLITLFGIMGSLGILLISQLDFSSTVNIVLIGTGVAFVALYVPTHFLFWSMQFAQSKNRGFITDIALSFTVFALATGLRLALGIHSLEITLACPLISTLLALYAAREYTGTRSRCSGETDYSSLNWGFIVPCLIFLALCTAGLLLFRLSGEPSVQPAGRSFSHFAIAAISAGIAFFYRPGAKKPRGATLRAFVLVSFTFIGCMLIALWVARTDTLADTTPLIVANTVLVEFIWLLIIRNANRMHSSPTTLAAAVLIFVILIPRLLRALIVFRGVMIPADKSSMNLLIIIGIAAFASALIAVVSLMRFFTITELSSAPEPALEPPKDDELFERLQKTFDLTNREVEVAQAAVTYATTEEMADKLFIAESTIRTHLKRIYRKTGVHSKQELLQLIDEYRPRS